MNVASTQAGLYPSMTLALRRHLQWTHLTPFDLTISDDTLAQHGDTRRINVVCMYSKKNTFTYNKI